MEETIIMSGLLYKKRGGFGKMMPHAWQQRFFFCSKDGMLYYFDSDGPDNLKSLTESVSKDSTKSRGRIDLRASHCEFSSEMLSEYSGAPTQYVIQIVPANGEEKWKLCCNNKEDYQKWTKELLYFTTKKIDDSEKNMAHNDNMNDQITTNTTGKEVHDGANGKQTNKIGKVRLKSNAAPQFDFLELLLTLIIMNLCYYYISTISSLFYRILYFIIANAVVTKTLIQRNQRKTPQSPDTANISTPSSLSTIKNDDAPKIESIVKVHPPAGKQISRMYLKNKISFMLRSINR